MHVAHSGGSFQVTLTRITTPCQKLGSGGVYFVGDAHFAKSPLVGRGIYLSFLDAARLFDSISSSSHDYASLLMALQSHCLNHLHVMRRVERRFLITPIRKFVVYWPCDLSLRGVSELENMIFFGKKVLHLWQAMLSLPWFGERFVEEILSAFLPWSIAVTDQKLFKKLVITISKIYKHFEMLLTNREVSRMSIFQRENVSKSDVRRIVDQWADCLALLPHPYTNKLKAVAASAVSTPSLSVDSKSLSSLSSKKGLSSSVFASGFSAPALASGIGSRLSFNQPSSATHPAVPKFNPAALDATQSKPLSYSAALR